MQKSLIVLVVGLLTVGCGPTPEEKQKALRDSVVGEYEFKERRNTYKLVFLENGIVEGYINGQKDKENYKWSISKEGKIHVEDKYGEIHVFSINKYHKPSSLRLALGMVKSITRIAIIEKDGERTDIPKEDQDTSKKIN